MARVVFLLALISIIGYASALSAPQYPVYVVPEHRSMSELKPIKLQEEIPYDYQIVPADQFQLIEVATESDSTETSIISSIMSSIWEVLPIPSPFAAIKKIASLAYSVAQWVLKKGVFVLLGVALTVAFCAFTPFCTLVIEKPFAKQIEDINIPYLEDAEYYLRQAYDKYHELY